MGRLFAQFTGSRLFHRQSASLVGRESEISGQSRGSSGDWPQTPFPKLQSPQLQPSTLNPNLGGVTGELRRLALKPIP